MHQQLNNLIISLKRDIDSDKIENINAFKQYFKEFFKKYPARDFFKVSEITFEEIMTSIILISNPYETIIMLEIIKEFPSLFEKDDFELIASIAGYYQEEEYQNAINKVLYASNTKDLDIAFKYLIKVGLFNGANVIKIKETCEILKEIETRKKLALIFGNLKIKDFKSAYNFYIFSQEFNDFLAEINRTRTKNKKIFDAILDSGDERMLYFTDYFNKLHSAYYDTLQKLDQELKDINRNNKRIDDLISLLSKEGEIKDIDKIIRLCPNEEIKSIVVNYILEHNELYYHSLIEHYNNLIRTSDESLTILFAKYNFDYLNLEENSKSLMKNYGYDRLEVTLKFLCKYKINFDIMNIVFIDIDKLKIIEDLLAKGFISMEFLGNNIQLLFSINNSLDLVLNNIDILNKHNINIINYINSLDILLNESLLKNLKILNDYGLNVKKETKCILFLKDNNLIQKLDLLIEMGVYEDLKSLDILNLSIEQLYKKKVFMNLNIELNDIDYLKEDFVTNFESFIPNDLINILNNNDNNEILLPPELNEYKINNYVLFINGIYVSINRLLRNLSKFESINKELIFYSIIYSSNYTLEEIESLSESLIQKDIYMLVRS